MTYEYGFRSRLRSAFGGWLGALLLAGCASTSMPDGSATRNGDAQARAGARPLDAAALPAALDAAPTIAAATPAPAPIDPLRPDEKIDLDAAAAHADLWGRVRRGFAVPDLDGDLVRDREQWYSSRPDYVARMTGRASRYLFHIVEEIERRGMPTELALLPFVESAFNPQAMSTAKASGMWQFIPSTGKDYLLKQNIFRDDRRDVLASTRAALDYLARLHTMFGDWHLALAAYNWGEGSVQRAIAKNERAGLPTDYQSLHMPDETRLYVPKLQAVKNLVARPDSFGLALPAVANHPYFLSVPIERDIDVDIAVRLAGISLEEFKTLNPQMNKPVILAAGTQQLLLPYDNANQFVRQLALHRGPLATWTVWVAQRTLRPADAAREVGMSESELRSINRIPFKMLVKAGSTLLVPRDEAAEADVSLQVADNATMALTPEVVALKRSVLRFGRRDASTSAASVRFVQAQLRLAPALRLPAAGPARPGSMLFVASTPLAHPAVQRAAVRASAKGRQPLSAPAAQVFAGAAPLERGARSGGRVRVAAGAGKATAHGARSAAATAAVAPHRIRVAFGR